MRLHAYGRSSASFRLRIALNLKGLRYETVTHDLSRDAHRDPGYLALNPQGLLPALEDDATVFVQSLAIIEYIDARHPEPPLLPRGEPARARVRALAQIIAADTHPIVAMRVTRHLRDALGADDDAIRAWQHHWLHESFRAFEAHLTGSPASGRFCHGDEPTIADIALVPQTVTAERLGFPVGEYSAIARIVDGCLDLPAFRHGHPDHLDGL